MSSGRTGFTTGTCAAAAAKAATMLLCNMPGPCEVEVGLPDGTRVMLPVEKAAGDAGSAEASVRKDAGDDPDVTDGCLVTARVEWDPDGDVSLLAGEGVGTVTKPGLSVPPGEPAINPVPRRMIREAVREVTGRGLRITVSVQGGKELAKKTFNPRLGVEGGLSILGTSGIVRPFSTPALRDALKCALSVAVACSVRCPVFVPGRIGEKAARNLFQLSSEQLIEVSNEWGFLLDEAAGVASNAAVHRDGRNGPELRWGSPGGGDRLRRHLHGEHHAEAGKPGEPLPFDRLMVLGHPGKLAKLPAGWWDTHSSRSGSAVPAVLDLATEVFGRNLSESPTVEGIFNDLPPTDRRLLADALAARVHGAVSGRIRDRFEVSVVLVNMRGVLLGMDGDVTAWQRKTGSLP